MTGQNRGKDIGDVEELIKLLLLPEEFATKVHSALQDTYRTLWRKLHRTETRYIAIWRNQWVTAKAKSLPEVVQLLQQASEQLAAMLSDGVTLDSRTAMANDYVYLITTDPKIAILTENVNCTLRSVANTYFFGSVVLRFEVLRSLFGDRCRSTSDRPAQILRRVAVTRRTADNISFGPV